jgi:para-aminobenzoate synthetase component 2
VSAIVMIFLLDNYDSFTYNLAQYLGELGQPVEVRRNDRVTLAEIEALQPVALIISPGPCTPDEAGISVAAVRHFAGLLPILGVCLGHQAIAQAFGGRIVRAPILMHGKTSPIEHDGRTIFRGLPQPFAATRYHSLVLDPSTVPDGLEISARSPDGVIMALRHRRFPIEGVQFHPESILTLAGKQLLSNFLNAYLRPMSVVPPSRPE